MNLIDNFVSVGSGWKVHHVMSVSISFAPYRPMQGSSYISNPKELLRKQAVLNIQNWDDNYCILYTILAHIHPLTREDHPSRPQKYIKFMSDQNYEGLEFPLKITDVPKLDMMNPDISVHVLFYKNHNPFPPYNSPHRTRKYHVNLLLIMDEKSGNSHYLLIRSLSRLAGDRTNYQHSTHVCPYFLYCFSKADLLRSHIPECSIPPPQGLEYPSPKHDGDTEYNILKFKNFAQNSACLNGTILRL